MKRTKRMMRINLRPVDEITCHCPFCDREHSPDTVCPEREVMLAEANADEPQEACHRMDAPDE